MDATGSGSGAGNPAKKKQKKFNAEKSDLEERVSALEEENLKLRLVSPFSLFSFYCFYSFPLLYRFMI